MFLLSSCNNFYNISAIKNTFHCTDPYGSQLNAKAVWDPYGMDPMLYVYHMVRTDPFVFY